VPAGTRLQYRRTNHSSTNMISRFVIDSYRNIGWKAEPGVYCGGGLSILTPHGRSVGLPYSSWLK